MTVYTVTDASTEVRLTTAAGSPSDRVWIGTHRFRLKCTNGSTASGKLFNTVYSGYVDVKIIDPCTRAIINYDLGVKIGHITAPASSWSFPSGSTEGLIAATGTES